MSIKTISPELLEQIRRDREAVKAELPDLQQRHQRMVEAKSEETVSGQLRRAIHGSGRLIREIATDAGITSEQLSDFLEGTRTLRSDVLDRVALAAGASVRLESVAAPQVTKS